MAELRVLVCDDDSDMLELMLRRLDKMGFKPDRAGDGGVAQALIKENLYDLIVTDIYMPEATGLELLQLAKQRDPQVQVVIVTASATLDNAIHALNQGAFGYLSKPFDHLSVFDSTVSRALEFRQLVLANRRMAEAQKMRGDMLEDEVAKRVGQLREKQQGLLDLLNCLPDGIVVVEEGGKLLMTSPAAEQWLARERRSEQQPISEFLRQVHSEWAESSGYAQLDDDSLKLLSIDYPHPNGKRRKAVIIRRAEEEEAKESAGPGTLAVQSLAAIKEGLAWLFRQQLTGPMQQRIMAIAKHINLLEQLTGGAADSASPVKSSAPVLEPASLPEYLLHEPMLDEPGAQWEEADLASARENGKQPAVDHGLLEPDTQPSRALTAVEPIEEIEAAELLPEIVVETQPEFQAEAAAESAGLIVQPEPVAILQDDLASAPTRVLSRGEAAAQKELEAVPDLEEQAQLEERPGEPEPEPAAAELAASALIAEPAQPEDTGRIPLWRRFTKGRGAAHESATAAAIPAKAGKEVVPRDEPEIGEPGPQQTVEPVDEIEELEREPESLAEVAARLEALIERQPEPEEPAVKPRSIRAKASIASAKAKAVVEARAARSAPAQKATIREPEPALVAAPAPPSPGKGKKKSWPPNLPSQDPDFNPELDVSG
jgi:DNA-binding response OmpR family regulator